MPQNRTDILSVLGFAYHTTDKAKCYRCAQKLIIEAAIEMARF